MKPTIIIDGDDHAALGALVHKAIEDGWGMADIVVNGERLVTFDTHIGDGRNHQLELYAWAAKITMANADVIVVHNGDLLHHTDYEQIERRVIDHKTIDKTMGRAIKQTQRPTSAPPPWRGRHDWDQRSKRKPRR